MSDAAKRATAVRAGAGLFRHEDRGVVDVAGGDAVRWLDGMLSNDVASLEPGPERSGCYATLLTPKGRIVADLHVLSRGPGHFWLETARAAAADVVERLERYIVADDVVLADRSAELDRLGVEGPRATAVMASIGAGACEALALDACCEVEIAGHPVVVARFGWSGEPGFQLFAPAGAGDRLEEALREAAPDLVAADAEVLEVLRIEAGLPRLGSELDEEVFPDEARLERAISRSKGCYTGQEIVARLYSRGAVNHLLVGLRFEGAAGDLPSAGTPLLAGDRETGEVTSVCLSETGAIGLGFVRREHAEVGTELSLGSSTASARVAELPLVEGLGSP